MRLARHFVTTPMAVLLSQSKVAAQRESTKNLSSSWRTASPRRQQDPWYSTMSVSSD